MENGRLALTVRGKCTILPEDAEIRPRRDPRPEARSCTRAFDSGLSTISSRRLQPSDMFANKVVTCTPDGTLDTVLDTGSVWPSGLGFLPDGSLVVATMQDSLL